MKKSFIKIFTLSSILLLSIVLLTGCNINISINNTPSPEPEKVPATKISKELKHDEDTKHYMVITGLDDKDNVVWTYTTQKDYAGQYENIELISETDEQLLLNEAGTITALDKKYGTVIWMNNEYKGSETLFTTDSEGYIYLTSNTKPYLFVLTPEGKTLKKIEKIEDPDLTSPSKIQITDDSILNIIYPSHVTDGVLRDNKITVNLKDIKNTDNGVQSREVAPQYNNKEIAGFKDIQKFNLTPDGDVYLTFKPDSVLARKCNSTKLLIQKDVKSITPVFWGNGGYGTLVMIKTDGTVCFLDSTTTESGFTTIRTSEYQNIDYLITIDTLDGLAYGLVNKSGVVFIDRV